MNLFVCVVDREGLGLSCKGDRVRLAFQVYKMGEWIIYCRLLYDRCPNIYVCVCFFYEENGKIKLSGITLPCLLSTDLERRKYKFQGPSMPKCSLRNFPFLSPKVALILCLDTGFWRIFFPCL